MGNGSYCWLPWLASRVVARTSSLKPFRSRTMKSGWSKWVKTSRSVSDEFCVNNAHCAETMLRSLWSKRFWKSHELRLVQINGRSISTSMLETESHHQQLSLITRQCRINNVTIKRLRHDNASGNQDNDLRVSRSS